MRETGSIRTRAAAVALSAAAFICVCAGVASSAGETRATSWVPVGSLSDSDQVTFAGDGLAFASDGGGVLAWETYPDLETRAVAALTADSRVTRVALAPPFAAGATQVLALNGRRAVIGGIEGGSAKGSFALETAGPGGHSLRLVVPGARQHLQSQVGVIAANRAGEIAVLGESGAQPVLTVCSAAAGCGRTLALAPSTGVLDLNGAEAQGTGLAVAITAGGDVLAAWVGNGTLDARWRTPAGRLGPTQPLARVHSQIWLAASVSVSGRAALVWESQDDEQLARPGPASSPTIVQAATAPTAGRFAAPQTLDRFPASDAFNGPADAALSEPPVVAVAFVGTRPIAAWTGHSATGFTIRVADLDSVGNSTQTLSVPGQSSTLGALATANTGAVVAWLGCDYDSQHVCWPRKLQAARATPGQPFGVPATLPGASYDATLFSRDAVAAIDPITGRAWIAAASGDQLDLFTDTAP